MCLPYPCILAQEMLFDEHSESLMFETERLTQDTPLMHPIVVSEIAKSQAYSKFFNLRHLTQFA
jgi:hypothetical protein